MHVSTRAASWAVISLAVLHVAHLALGILIIPPEHGMTRNPVKLGFGLVFFSGYMAALLWSAIGLRTGRRKLIAVLLLAPFLLGIPVAVAITFREQPAVMTAIRGGLGLYAVIAVFLILLCQPERAQEAGQSSGVA
jgi:hypothetical protein